MLIKVCRFSSNLSRTIVVREILSLAKACIFLRKSNGNTSWITYSEQVILRAFLNLTKISKFMDQAIQALGDHKVIVL